MWSVRVGVGEGGGVYRVIVMGVKWGRVGAESPVLIFSYISPLGPFFWLFPLSFFLSFGGKKGGKSTFNGRLQEVG